jgi:thiamine pyrophosphate-dependent acetolactate synthase large subunit-like protein
MNPNILCEISTTGPANLTIIVLDNGTYGTTGDQKTAAYDRIDLELVARSFGIKNTMKAATKTKIARALASFGAGPNLLHVPTKPGKSKAHPDLMPVEVKERFMKALSRRQLKSLG